jgi:hypothetical protein
MLEKIPGRPLLHKLRVIRLHAANLNLSLGILWGRRLIAQGGQLMARNNGVVEVAAVLH